MPRRKHCQVCDKALPACICGQIQQIDSSHELIILQHPSEVKQAIGTARILMLSLPNCQLWVEEDFSKHVQLQAMLKDPSRQCVLLYPGESALTVNELHQSSERNTEQRYTFIILDGTWRKTYKLLQLCPPLAVLPRVQLTLTEKSHYRLRKSSKKAGLSTVEAGYHLLTELDGGDVKYRPLLDVFNSMIDYQISRMPAEVYAAHYLNAE